MIAQPSNLPRLPPVITEQILVDAFRSTPVDLTLLSSRKVPAWVARLDTTPLQGEFVIWLHYWRNVQLYIPGEAWYPVDPSRLMDGSTGRSYEQPWCTSMRRMLKFAKRLFCYPEHNPSDPNARPQDFPHPARLRDLHLINLPQSIDFEVLCKFDPQFPERDIFRDMEERVNIRALLWLFKTLKCHHVQNRHRLNIVLKWEDIRCELLEDPILECRSGPENIYANKDENSKAAIPFGLGIQEKYMEVTNEGLIIWTTYLLERERLVPMTKLQRKRLPAIDPTLPRTVQIGTLAARKNVQPNVVVTSLVYGICDNLRKKVYHDYHQVAYVEFWQRVTLNIAPQCIGQLENGDPKWDVSSDFEGFVKDRAHKDPAAMSDFAANMRSFVLKHKVEPEDDRYFPHSVAPLCFWDWIGIP